MFKNFRNGSSATFGQNSGEFRASVDPSEAWRNYSVEFGNENSLIASLPYGNGRGHAHSPAHTRGGWNIAGLSKG